MKLGSTVRNIASISILLACTACRPSNPTEISTADSTNRSGPRATPPNGTGPAHLRSSASPSPSPSASPSPVPRTPPRARAPVTVPVTAPVSAPVTAPAPSALAPQYITCEIARQIDERWDSIVEEIHACFFDAAGSGKGPRGKLNAALSVCTSGDKSLQLIPPLVAASPVLFGDDHSFAQTVLARARGEECFSLTRKANPGDSGNLLKLTRGSTLLFETTRNTREFRVRMGDQEYYLPTDSATLREYTRSCGVNINGRWGSDHVFYGPSTIFQSFTLHLSKSNRLRFSSACDR